VNEGKSEHDVAWEARVVTALAAAGVPTPSPLATREGQPYGALPDSPNKWVTAFKWRPGHHLDASDVTALHAEKLGAALAQLHVRGLSLIVVAPPPTTSPALAAAARLMKSPFERPAIELRTSIYDHAHLVGRFVKHIAASTDPQLERARQVLREELDAAESHRAVRAAATHGLIHGDLFRDNVLWDAGEITALLDFEQASEGSLVYDLAVCINDWCWSESERAPRADLVSAMVQGYEAVRPLTAADRAALPVELRASAARFTITRITDVYLARVANPEKDFRAFLARCDAWRTEALRVVTNLV